MEANFINQFRAFNRPENKLEHNTGENSIRFSQPSSFSEAAPVKAERTMATNDQPDGTERSKTLYALAHDLKNPLSTIISLTELVLRRGELTDEIKEYINHIRRISASSLEFTQDVIYSANINAEESVAKPHDINEIVIEALNTLKYQALEKEQQLFFEPDEATAQASVNKAQIIRVVSNIINNAIKFTGHNKNIKITVSNLAAHVLISVQDEGIGIPAQMRYYIFDQFTNAKRQGTSGESSSGLGLSICKQIIEKHNGEIWFEDAKPLGTIFFVRLPKNI
ncbi:HAMP domain-containing histidine kinase [Mucilaginibacter sp. UR6-1]|uniref:sensor histidine kinase n=1 Tax=Mucilaginibacter sp. UR6-1 TaxID=1435643 RepID=UPI001E4F2D52|nr:HAMP domain-containing sensor histidine kinase [Mucilaginibacter sp. UR6-1]MCC8408076.1 HAMP domain-containing histidine kinase [Mucilaginibacter sp. UR6-1]